jgi:hypothetical protein
MQAQYRIRYTRYQGHAIGVHSHNVCTSFYSTVGSLCRCNRRVYGNAICSDVFTNVWIRHTKFWHLTTQYEWRNRVTFNKVDVAFGIVVQKMLYVQPASNYNNNHSQIEKCIITKTLYDMMLLDVINLLQNRPKTTMVDLTTTIQSCQKGSVLYGRR